MQIKLRLNFSSDSAQLLSVRTRFPGRNLEISAYRGSALYSAAGSFTWSSAVHALSILFLRSSLGCPAPQLTGERGSAAAALDYAINKEPRWMIDMFGVDGANRSFLRRLIRRRNPNLKRPGPVELAFSDDSEIQIEIDGQHVSNMDEVRQLLSRLELSWRPYGGRSLKAVRKTTASPNQTWSICSIYQAEVARSLAAVDIFDRDELKSRVSRIVSHPNFSSIDRSDLGLFEQISTELPPSSRLGLSSESFLRRELCKDDPIRIAASFVSAGASALFWYLKTVKGYNIEIDDNFAHSLEISNRILADDPAMNFDLCAIADVPAASLVTNRSAHEFTPTMLLPSVSQRIVAPREVVERSPLHKPAIAGGSYRYICNSPSTSQLYFKRFAGNGTICAKKCESVHREPDEAARDLRSGDDDLRAILFFPYFNLNQHLNNCRAIDGENTPDQNADMFLFSSKAFKSERSRLQALQIAVRDAWFEMRSSRAASDSAVADYTASSNFNRVLERCSGFPDDLKKAS